MTNRQNTSPAHKGCTCPPWFCCSDSVCLFPDSDGLTRWGMEPPCCQTSACKFFSLNLYRPRGNRDESKRSALWETKVDFVALRYETLELHILWSGSGASRCPDHETSYLSGSSLRPPAGPDVFPPAGLGRVCHQQKGQRQWTPASGWPRPRALREAPLCGNHQAPNLQM